MKVLKALRSFFFGAFAIVWTFVCFWLVTIALLFAPRGRASHWVVRHIWVATMLAELFAAHDRLDNLQTFVSDNARRIYGVEPPAKTVVLQDTPVTVPERYGDVVPMHAGGEIGWSVVCVR